MRATVKADTYVSAFRHPEQFIEYCKSCPSMGKTWICPPIESEFEIDFSKFKTVDIIAVKVDRGENMLEERDRLMEDLLMLERETGGRAFGLASVGGCRLCPGGCTRPAGNKCRHPELVRPPLEAYGFDLMATSSEILKTPMVWGLDGKAPEYLMLIGAVFY